MGICRCCTACADVQGLLGIPEHPYHNSTDQDFAVLLEPRLAYRNRHSMTHTQTSELQPPVKPLYP